MDTRAPMSLLQAGVPLSLLCDLATDREPESRLIYRAESDDDAITWLAPSVRR